MLSVEQVDVRFGDSQVLLGFDLTVATGEIVALQGPSGCGKSTVLRVIAGLLRPDGGAVRWMGDDLSGVPTHRRSIGMVFQDEQLFPHMSVAANVGFGLKMLRWERTAVRSRVDELLELVGLRDFGSRRVGALSGGEAKRVALARALAPSPKVLLLDEPLTGLDAELHDRLALDVRRVLTGVGITAVHVTHDPAEASVIADRVVRLV